MKHLSGLEVHILCIGLTIPLEVKSKHRIMGIRSRYRGDMQDKHTRFVCRYLQHLNPGIIRQRVGEFRILFRPKHILDQIPINGIGCSQHGLKLDGIPLIVAACCFIGSVMRLPEADITTLPSNAANGSRFSSTVKDKVAACSALDEPSLGVNPVHSSNEKEEGVTYS